MKQNEIYNAYKHKADTLMNYQMCKGYFGVDESMTRLAEKILKRKYCPTKYDIEITMAFNRARGVRNAVIDLPMFNYKSTIPNIFEKFVKDNFDRMVWDIKENGLGKYPISFRDLIEKVEERKCRISCS